MELHSGLCISLVAHLTKRLIQSITGGQQMQNPTPAKSREVGWSIANSVLSSQHQKEQISYMMYFISGNGTSEPSISEFGNTVTERPLKETSSSVWPLDINTSLETDLQHHSPFTPASLRLLAVSRLLANVQLSPFADSHRREKQARSSTR